MNVTLANRFRTSVVLGLALVAASCGGQATSTFTNVTSASPSPTNAATNLATQPDSSTAPKPTARASAVLATSATSAPSASSAPSLTPSPATPSPAPPNPTLIPSSAHSPSPAPASTPPGSSSVGPSWEGIDVGGVTLLETFVGWDGGYVNYGFDTHIYFSTDAWRWQSVDLPPSDPQCEDYALDEPEKAAANGPYVLLLGSYNNEDCELQSFAWISGDGRNWQRSEPIGEPHSETEAFPTDVWAVPNGWEAAIGLDRGVTDIFHSADGLSWQKKATLDAWGNVDGEADASGTRLVSINESTSSFGTHRQLMLATSTDGRTWRELDWPLPGGGSGVAITDLVSPTTIVPSWAVVLENQVPGLVCSSVSVSQDLATWQPLTTGTTDSCTHIELTATPAGLVATTRATEADRQYLLTTNGEGWARIHPGIGRSWIDIASGPAGVLALTGDGVVYRLHLP
jgi:hypothetical protein